MRVPGDRPSHEQKFRKLAVKAIQNRTIPLVKRFDTGDGVGDRDPQAQPTLDVLDGLLRRDHEEVGIAIGQIQGIEAGTLRMGEKRREVEE